jgi:hypothetical protein
VRVRVRLRALVRVRARNTVWVQYTVAAYLCGLKEAQGILQS